MRFLAAALFFCAAINGGAMSSSVPTAVPTYVSSAPKLDGNLNDKAWQQAAKTGDFKVRETGQPACRRTDVRICYDRSTLYLAFECFHERTDRILVENTADGGPVWNDDSVEIFISADSVANAGNCHQFVVNAAGAKTHLRPWSPPSSVNWRAAVTRFSDKWVLEVAIPFETLGPLGKNSSCWRANLCRNISQCYEMTSWSFVPRFYATYSCFGKLVPPEARVKFARFRGEPVALKADTGAFAGARELTEQAAPVRASDYIVPEPREVHEREGTEPFRITPDTLLVIDDDAGEADMWTVEEINAAIEKLGGKRLGIIHGMALGSSSNKARNAIIVGESARNTLLKAVAGADKIDKPAKNDEAYVLDVVPERVAIIGSGVKGTYYGAQTLKQLIRKEADGLVVPAISIQDAPRFPFRGVHLLTSKDALTYIGKLIENVLAPLKVNHIVLQTDKVAWASHPEITDKTNAMPREDVPKLIEIARKHHIQVTPMVQSPGHLEWAFRYGNNLEFAEDPKKPYCYCMTNPKSYEFIFSIMDEAIELFGHPEYFHAGRDEFDMLGTMPCDDRCKAIGKEKLYAEDTVKVYEHLKSKGCKVMMWGDVLDKTGFKDHIEGIPKDILINDWRYAPSATYPSVDFYLSHGFQVVGCTWYNTHNIHTFSEYAAKKNIEGMMQTTWTGWASEADTLRLYPDQVYAYVLSAAWAWNPAVPAPQDLPYRPNAVFEKLWYGEIDDRQGFAPIRLDKHCNISRTDSSRRIGWLGKGAGDDLSALPEGLAEIEGTPYVILPGKPGVPAAIMLGGGALSQFPRQIQSVEVNAKLTALNFLHGCAYASDKGARVGGYTIHYEDSRTEQIHLTYGKEIFAWDDQSATAFLAWKIRAKDGRQLGISDLRWKNPRPDVKITSIDFAAEDTEASPFLLALTGETTP